MEKGATAQKKKILLVDDEEMLRIYFRDIFWIHGLENQYEVTTAEDPAKAEALIRDETTRPDIIFLDLVMPIEVNGRMQMTPEAGMMLLAKIKSDPKLKDIKVIIFSSHAEHAYLERAKNLGADTYLVKGDHLPQDILSFITKYSAH